LKLQMPSEGFKLQVDSDLLSQALINILKNAMEAIKDHGRPDGVITVAASTGRQISLHITDNGGGISDEVKEKIFIPFFTSKPEGSGIGLSVVKQILQLHQATIVVNSKENSTTFTMTF
ncbi:MAG: ATP-binding protein, partial [Bacteroidota bacterium]